MAKWRKLLKYFFDADYRFVTNARRGKYKHWDDETFLKRCYKARMKKALSLENPQTFNEKLQWLKLYDRKPIYTTMVDKHDVKAYVAERIGAEYIIPTLGVWDAFDEIDFDALPSQFVLKCTHDSGGVVICKDKARFDFVAARQKIEKSLKRDFFSIWREWPYKNVKPRVIAEQFMSDDDGDDLRDYKIHCFNGKPKFILVCQDRFRASGLTEDFYSESWTRLPVKRPTHTNAKEPAACPENLEKMLKLAEELTTALPFGRIDFYEVNHKIYFGEITFYPASGFSAFEPEEWDYTLGSWLQLPQKTR